MNKLFAIINKFLHPPKYVLFFAPPIIFAALIYIFAIGKNNCAPAYVIYTMSAYCLVILIFPIFKSIQNAKAAAMRCINSTAFGEKYLSDLAFRGKVSLYRGTIANFLYVIFRIFAVTRYASVWFISMAIYYSVLWLIRLTLAANYHRRNNKNELRCYRQTAWLLFLLNIPMGGMILLMVQTNSGFSYPGYVIYLSALYTFYTMTVSIINLVKFRKLGTPVLSAAKALNFIAALMSVLGLQTAMISQFSPNDNEFRKMMNAITGGFIWIAVILTALYMLYRSRKTKTR